MNQKKNLAASKAQAVQREKDEDLATFTDTLLAHPGAFPADEPPLHQTVALLAQTLDVQPPPLHLQRAIQQRARAELPTTPSMSWWGALRAFLRASPQRRVWSGIAVLFLLGMATLLLNVNPRPGDLPGAALTSNPGLLLAGIVLLGGGALIIWLLTRHCPP